MALTTLCEIEKLPKVDLHRHVDGSVKSELVWQLAKYQGKQLLQNSVEKLDDFLKIHQGMSVEQIMAKFDLVKSFMQTWEDIALVFYEQVIDLAKENIVYTELRFAPEYHTCQGLTLEQVVRAALYGIRKGQRYCRRDPALSDVKVKLILCIARECGMAMSKKVAQIAISFQDAGVVAVDLACNEAKYPPELHVPAYSLINRSRLYGTAHAGEFGDTPISNIRACQRMLRVNRLGHANGIAKHSDLLSYCSKGKIGIEICPISIKTSGGIKSFNELELNVLESAGVLFNINSDDPALFGKSLSENILAVATVYQWSLNDIIQKMRDAVEMSFQSEVEKKQLVQMYF
ncbi:MAG: adenosine deaminase [bacterium]|nr:adenosine deaminase [bacterium]